jgi:TonB family protein
MKRFIFLFISPLSILFALAAFCFIGTSSPILAQKAKDKKKVEKKTATTTPTPSDKAKAISTTADTPKVEIVVKKEETTECYTVIPDSLFKLNKPLLVAEKMPEFPGGQAEMQKYVQQNLVYPELARQKGISGTVAVRFVVKADGQVDNIEVLRSVGGGCDEEAVRVVRSMPRWSPGVQNKRAVPVYFTIPIRFNLTTPAEPQNTSATEPLLAAEKMPEFPGGQAEMFKYIQQNLVYPEIARQKGISGTVAVRFVVKTDGQVDNIEVTRGIGGGCDQEAMRVIRSMPRWTPGMHDGKIVAVYFILPVKFKL